MATNTLVWVASGSSFEELKSSMSRMNGWMRICSIANVLPSDLRLANISTPPVDSSVQEAFRKMGTSVPKTVLRLPDLDLARSAALNSLSSPDAQRGYRHAIEEFIESAVNDRIRIEAEV